ncbi:MAG: HAD family hydrolase [Deltaproteobacteria bacterium]|nr:MAG: HAD family hydrolase [Deltaproteobacteria bacterium]
MRKKTGILFDLDGTLLNSLDDLAGAANRVLEEAGCPVHPVSSFRHFVGNGAQELIRRILPEEKRNGNFIAACHKRFLELYPKSFNDRTKPYPGISKLLQLLQELAVPVGVITNKPHDAAITCVKDYLHSIDTDFVAGQKDDVLDVLPEESFYVGDSDVDMHTAANAGMTGVGVLWGFRDAQELEGAGASKLVGTPLEILDLL